MPDLSVIIPARKETWLLQTVKSIRAAIRGDTEIIVVIDGEEAEPRLPGEHWMREHNWPVRVIQNATPHGQRQAINEAARASTAKYILKTDAHSFLDEGFDLKLAAACEYDWIVLPRMWNLHSHDMVCRHCGERYYNRPAMPRCEKCGSETVSDEPAMIREVAWERNKKKPPTDFMFFRAPYAADKPLRIQYWDATTAREFPAEYAAHRAWAKVQPEIADVMSGQGACWFLHRDRYWELGGLDEGHGHWGQMGVEIACKAWLSGGRHVVNRKTWFAHLFRCGGSEGCPWEMDGNQQEAARQYSIDLWGNNKWPGQKRPLEWLIEKFWPVPTWNKPQTTPELRDFVLPGQISKTPTKPDLTVLYYTDRSLPAEFAQAVRKQLRQAAGACEIVFIDQLKDTPRGHRAIYENIQRGLYHVGTPYVALAEHDVLYPEGYFDHQPTHDVEYNRNRWRLHADQGVFTRKSGHALSQLFARTAALKQNIQERLQHPECYAERTKCFEPGETDEAAKLGITPITVGSFKSRHPTIDINGTGYNLTGTKRPRGETRERMKYWGTAAEICERFHVPISHATAEQITAQVRSFQPTASLEPDEQEKFEAAKSELLTEELAKAGCAPKVSILIPARNEEYLQATVRDLLEHLELPFEILVGLDGPDQSFDVATCAPDGMGDTNVRVIQSETRIGMRPMINRLAREAKGEYLIRLDAHCMIDQGMDAKLVEVCEREGHVGVVAMRYELDAQRWQRRGETDIPYRRLSHASEDGCGLRSLGWPQWAQAHQDEVIGETMSCSGSSWTCRRSTFVDWWGGFDEQHGTFGQEGCEIACMFWLSGGRFLVHKGTWYAHHNRGKSTYTLGAHVKSQSIKRSHELWVGNTWPHARYGFDYLIEKFSPPGWEAAIHARQARLAEPLRPGKQIGLAKVYKRLTVAGLWDKRDAIADPGKLYRIQIFWRAYDEFVRDVLADQPWDHADDGKYENWPWNSQYAHYLLGHVTRDPAHRPTPHEVRKVRKSLQDSVGLIKSIEKDGLKAPLEFYQEDGRLILWKGYRRLVIARALGIDRVHGRCFLDRQAAGALSPQAHLTRLQNYPLDDLHRLGEEQFQQWGPGGTDKYYTHGYTRYYDLHLHPIRKRAKRVLELGVLNGASLALWRQYFPRAELVGVDIRPDHWKTHAADLDRCTVLIGDETDAAFMSGVAARGPFDLIVDDASHEPALQRQAFEFLWPHVRQYGFYVIEDIYQSFSPEAKARAFPEGLEARIFSERDVLSIHHYYNIVFIQKG